MFALRSMSRVALRVVPRAMTSSTIAYRLPLAASISLRSQRAQFSISASARNSAESAEKLIVQLERELKYEEEASKEDQIPETISEFTRNSGFELVETTGSEEVKLVKQVGDEKITVLFSIADLGFNNPLLDDESFEEEEEESTNEPKNYENQEGDVMDDSMLDPTPIRVQVVVEKPGKAEGAISVDVTVQDGTLAIDSFYYFNKVSEAFASTAEVAHTRANVYAGPSFETLDEELQDKAEAYLNDRGIDAALAVFVGDYASWKEQTEYVGWMKNLAGFMRA